MGNMINKTSISKVNINKLNENFVIPMYNEYCFSNLIGTIKETLGIEKNKIKISLPKDVTLGLPDTSNKVILLLIDAFGFESYENIKEDSLFLKDIENRGVISKLTSQFPSTTTAHVTTITTGLPVYEHGLYEWYYYEPVIDEVIVPFLFSEGYKEEPESLREKKIDARTFLPRENFFSELSSLGIKSKVYNPRYINKSTYSSFMFKDSDLQGYDNLEELFTNLVEDLETEKEKAYYYVYIPYVDSVGHEYGMNSIRFKMELSSLIYNMDKYFYKNGKNKIKDTMMFLTADHGQTEIDLNNVTYINKLIPDIEKYFCEKHTGYPIVPTGFCRDMFLHIKIEYLEEVKELLKNTLEGIAEVYTFDELKEHGVFGNPSQRFLSRVGNIIIIPYDKNAVWWYEPGAYEIKFKGAHGGVTTSEMEIPLLAYYFK